VRPDEEANPRRFFDETDRSGKRNWKVQQLCKQVERAAAVTLAGECESDALLGAAVAFVEPAPDSSRLIDPGSPPRPVFSGSQWTPRPLAEA
jgi:hypothetical protein